MVWICKLYRFLPDFDEDNLLTEGDISTLIELLTKENKTDLGKAGNGTEADDLGQTLSRDEKKSVVEKV